MSPEERKDLKEVIDNIKRLSEKLIKEINIKVKSEYHLGVNIALTKKKERIREIRGILKDWLTTYRILKEALEII